MIKDYDKAEVKLDDQGNLDLINTNIVYEGAVDSAGADTTILIPIPMFTTGFINEDLVELQDGTIGNLVLMPDEPMNGVDKASYDINTSTLKSLVLKSYTNVTSEFLEKMPKFSIKENLTLKRNGVEIMQNVVRRVTEVQVLDAERVPLITGVVDAIVAAFQAVAGYQDPNVPNTPSLMNLALTPDLIQAISDATQEFSDKDEEMRTLLDELSQEVQTFINKTE
jgi:hypothetical protein